MAHVSTFFPSHRHFLSEADLCAAVFTVTGNPTTLLAIVGELDIDKTSPVPFLTIGATSSSSSHLSAARYHDQPAAHLPQLH